MTAVDDRNLFDLSGRVALITGGAGLIGTRIGRVLVANGARVILADLDGAVATRAAETVATESDGAAVGLACDVADPVSVRDAVAGVVRQWGGIDILFNNAASYGGDVDAFFMSFENYALQTWRKVMSVNLDGAMLVAQAVGSHMVETGRAGSIVQTASIYGLVAPDQRLYEGSERLGKAMSLPAVYAVSKSGVVGLSRYLATYWAHSGIRVNTLVPGGVDAGATNDRFRENYAARVPLGRMAVSDDLAGAALFLAGDASSYMTGQELIVDGGWTTW